MNNQFFDQQIDLVQNKIGQNLIKVTTAKVVNIILLNKNIR